MKVKEQKVGWCRSESLIVFCFTSYLLIQCDLLLVEEFCCWPRGFFGGQSVFCFETWSRRKEGFPMATNLPLCEPAPELVDVLLPALARCPGFDGACKHSVRWDPAAGHVPRGFRGATGHIKDVKLVLVCAEPGDPYEGESCEPKSGSARDRLRKVYTDSCIHLQDRVDQFARNIRKILDMAWPEMAFAEQMRRTWLMETVLCSAKFETDELPKEVENECLNRYVRGQLALFTNARVVALGGKAQKRLKAGKISFVSAFAASPPGCNQPRALESWRNAVAGLEP